MRAAHIDKAQTLLRGMAYTPVPTFTAIYPVSGWVPVPPTPQEMAVTLHPLHGCPNGMVTQLLNQTVNNELTDQDWNYTIPRDLSFVRSTLQATRDFDRVSSGIYAIAPGTILVALGAVIGNKNSLVAVPRYRSGGWTWLNNERQVSPFIVKEIDQLENYKDDGGHIPEVAVSLFFTDSPAEAQSAIEFLRQESNIPLISILSTQSGPKCIASPQDCQNLQQIMHELLHKLRNTHSTDRVHLFHCANNAALVEVGRGIEHFHPCVRVYEHTHEQGVKLVLPRLDITPDSNQVVINGTPIDDVNYFRQSYLNHHNKEVLAHV